MVKRLTALLRNHPSMDSCDLGPSDYENIIRDMIAAMREPTEAMFNAVADDVDAGLIWRDMIDEALK